METENEWLQFDRHAGLFNEEAKKNCLIKFEDGSVMNYDDEHPLLMLTHFKRACV